MKLFTAFVLVAVGLVVGCASKQPTTLRVLSYNIHHGAGMDKRLDLERIAQVIRDSNADLVALQEVDKGVQRTERVDQPAVLAELTGMRPIFEKNINYQGGEYGNAVLSRLPVEHWQNHHLPQSLPAEQRGMLEVHVTAGDQKLIFFATHFDYHRDDGERMASVNMFKDLLAEKGDVPIILAGDLNAKPGSRVIAELRTFVTDGFAVAEGEGFTFPANEPNRRIDYVLYQGLGLRCIEQYVIAEPVASDHRPLLTTFEIIPAPDKKHSN